MAEHSFLTGSRVDLLQVGGETRAGHWVAGAKAQTFFMAFVGTTEVVPLHTSITLLSSSSSFEVVPLHTLIALLSSSSSFEVVPLRILEPHASDFYGWAGALLESA